MHNLCSTRDNEGKLLQDAKQYTSDLEKAKVELEKADNFPESSNTEVSKLRQQLLKHNNDLKQADERQYQLDYKIEWYYKETIKKRNKFNYLNGISLKELLSH